MKILVLGGAGSVGRKICEIGLEKGYEVTGADLKKFSSQDIDSIQLDVLNLDSLAEIVDKITPNVIVNCLNIATIFFRKSHDNLTDITKFHVGLYPVLKKLKEVHYIQVGTTGSGGMGMNVPFSHGEKLSNLPLFYKASYAGICTILLTLLSRSFGDNNHKVSEIKPGLAIFQDSFTKKSLDGVKVVTSDGGENGDYTYNELAILTAFMGFTTAEKIAEKVFSVIEEEEMEEKHSSSYDVIKALNQTIVSQDEEDLEIRDSLLEKMEKASSVDSIIATGNLGPPSLTRDLILGSIILKDNCQNESEFRKAFAESVSCKQTLAYISSTNKDLGDYLKSECNFENFRELQKCVGNHRFTNPWELVAEKLGSVTIDSLPGK